MMAKNKKVKVNLDDSSIGFEPIVYTWQGVDYTIDILDMVQAFAPHLDVIKNDPKAFISKFKRLIDQPDMPGSKVIYLLTSVCKEVQGVLDSKKNSSELLSSLGFTQDLVSKLSKDLPLKTGSTSG